MRVSVQVIEQSAGEWFVYKCNHALERMEQSFSMFYESVPDGFLVHKCITRSLFYGRCPLLADPVAQVIVAWV